MKLILTSDYPLTDDACNEATGKSMREWQGALDGRPELEGKRRETINFLYDAMGKNAWWPTTIWVERQRARGVVLKDGMPDGYNICSTKTVVQPASEVMSAFLTESKLAWFDGAAKSTDDGGFADSHGNTATLVRHREGKDLRYTWQSAGVNGVNEIEVLFAEKDGKTGITLNHNRIQSRDEADGLRRAWAEALTQLKQQLESQS